MWKSLILALLLVPFVSACAHRLSDEDRNAALMLEQNEAQRMALIQDFAQHAANGNVPALLALLQPVVIESNGRDAVAGYLQTEILPFFKDYQRLAPESDSLRFEYGYGSVGRQYFQFLEANGGERHPFVITLLADKGKLAISSIEVGECLKGYHTRCPADQVESGLLQTINATDPADTTGAARYN